MEVSVYGYVPHLLTARSESCDLGYLPSWPWQSRAERSGLEGCRKYVRLWLLQRNSWKKAGAPRSAMSVITAVRPTALFAEVSSHSKQVSPRHDSSHITFYFHCFGFRLPFCLQAAILPRVSWRLVPGHQRALRHQLIPRGLLESRILA